MKLEIGAGARPHDGFLAYDVNPMTADVIGDALHLPFANGCVTEMRAVDVLEHISYRDTDAALAEWARVLAPGADVYVQVPDAATIMKWYASNDRRLCRWENGEECSHLRGAEWRLLGGHADGKYVEDGGDFRWNAHYSMWSRLSLGAALEGAGLQVLRIERNAHPNLLAWARR